MPHARLTHPNRATLPFRQGQIDEAQREAITSATNELGTDRKTLVHTETTDQTRTVQGLVSAPRRAANDPNTSDWKQALANYLDLLESSVDEFQGDGYTFEDDQLDLQQSAVLESISWTFARGQPFDIEYEATVRIGRGTFEVRPLDRRTPTVDESMTVMATVDGVDLPGLRNYAVSRSVGLDVTGVFDRDSAENNDAVFNEGVQQSITFEGTHTGTLADRQAADAALTDRVATKDPVTLNTQFPGYTLEGYLTSYNSNLEARFGDGRHDYALEFIEGRRA